MYSLEQKKILLATARASIQYGLTHHAALAVQTKDYEPELLKKRATFVTLKIAGDLRGCIGVLEAFRPLIVDVADNAYSAAFRDSRFPVMTSEELENLDISISVLSPAEPVSFDSEADLIKKIRPGVDGLILEDGYHRGTFLPSVWEQVQSPAEFLKHLKFKAGLSHDYWSETIKISRYTTELIGV